MIRVIARFGLLGAALVLVLLVGEYALFYRPTGTSIVLGFVAAVVLAAGVWLGMNVLRPKRARSVDPQDVERRIEARGITPREYEVLQLVAAGHSNQEIADELFIAETTVKSHVSSLLEKLGARRRTEAVSIAQDEGLLLS